jgi:GAF domain-containing protein
MYVERAGRIAFPKGFTWNVITEGKPRYCSDVDEDTLIGTVGREVGTKSYLSMPILFESKTVGTINVHSFRKNAFDEEELKLLEIVAQQISVAINNARQAEALRQSEKTLRETLTQLSKKKRYESIISAITQSVHRSINLQEVLENAAQAMRKNIDKVDRVAIYLVEGDEAVLRTPEGFPDWYVKSSRKIPYPGGLTWKTIIEGKPMYVADVDQDTVIGTPGRELGIKSYVSMPILFEGKAVGAVIIASHQKNTFNEDEIKLLEIVAQQVGTAINNAQKAEALQKAQAELAHVARLATLGEMIASIAHEINQPLAAVVNNASACLRWLKVQNLEEARKSAEVIIADGHRASEIIGRIRALAKKAPTRKEWLDINDAIRDVIALVRSEAQRNGVVIETHFSDDMPLMLGDRIELQQLVLNLMMNAIEAMSGVGDGRESYGWVRRRVESGRY